MTQLEDRYQSPASEEASAEALRLTKEEWRYAAKVFALWLLGASCVRGLVTTVKLHSATTAFNAPKWTSLFVALHAQQYVCVGVVLSSVYAACIFVLHRRMHQGVGPPQRGMFWPSLLIPSLLAPIAALLVFLWSLVHQAVFSHLLPGVQAVPFWELASPWDMAFGEGITAVLAFLVAVTLPDVARLVMRTQEWFILKLITATTVVLVAEHISIVVIRIVDLPPNWPLPWYDSI